MEYLNIFLAIIGPIILGVISNLASEPVKKYVASLSEAQRLKRIAFLEWEIEYMNRLSEDKSFFHHKSIENVFFLLKHGLIALGISSIAFSSYMFSYELSEELGMFYLKFLPLFLTFHCCLYFTYIAGYTSSWYRRVQNLYDVTDYIYKVESELTLLRKKVVV